METYTTNPPTKKELAQKWHQTYDELCAIEDTISMLEQQKERIGTTDDQLKSANAEQLRLFRKLNRIQTDIKIYCGGS